MISLGTRDTLAMILALALGTLAGEMLDFDGKMEQLGLWLKSRADRKGDSRFVQGFVTASLVVCIGAMAIVGSIQDGLTGNASTLYTKSILDFMIVMIFGLYLRQRSHLLRPSGGGVSGGYYPLRRSALPLVQLRRHRQSLPIGGYAHLLCGHQPQLRHQVQSGQYAACFGAGCGLYRLGAASALLKLVRLKILLAAFQDKSGDVISRTFSFIRFLSCHWSLGLMSYCGKSKILKKFRFFTIILPVSSLYKQAA